MRRCRYCHCTDAHACPGGCAWLSDNPASPLFDVCTACMDAAEDEEITCPANQAGIHQPLYRGDGLRLLRRLPRGVAMIAGTFVWIKGLRRPVAEKWPADAPAGVKADKVVLAEHRLGPDEFALKLAILEQRYPAPEQNT